MYNKYLVILSALLFASNNISFSMDDDIDSNINFPKESMNQDLNNNTINNNNNNNSSFIKLCSIIDNNSVAKDYDDVDFNIDFFPQNVKKEEKKQFSDTDRDSYNNNIINIVPNNIVQGDIKQLPIDLRNIKPFEIDEVALQRSIQQYMAMSYNERQEFLNNIFKNDTKQIMQDNNNIKSDNSTGNSKFKDLFDSIKASDQNNSQQFYCNNIKNLFNNPKIKNSNTFILSNNTSQQLQCNNTKNFSNKNTQYNNKFTLSNNLMGYQNKVNSGINTKSLQQNNKLFFIQNMKKQQYYQYNIPCYKINYSSQNITNNYVKNNPINSQKDNEKSEIVNNKNNHNACENINSRSMNSKDSKISNDKNRTNKNNK